jgi:hypothetical protein
MGFIQRDKGDVPFLSQFSYTTDEVMVNGKASEAIKQDDKWGRSFFVIL